VADQRVEDRARVDLLADLAVFLMAREDDVAGLAETLAEREEADFVAGFAAGFVAREVEAAGFVACEREEADFVAGFVGREGDAAGFVETFAGREEADLLVALAGLVAGVVSCLLSLVGAMAR